MISHRSIITNQSYINTYACCVNVSSEIWLFSEPAGCGSYSEMPSVEIAEMKWKNLSCWERLACIHTQLLLDKLNYVYSVPVISWKNSWKTDTMKQTLMQFIICSNNQKSVESMKTSTIQYVKQLHSLHVCNKISMSLVIYSHTQHLGTNHFMILYIVMHFARKKYTILLC